jgi:hypothetical protein
MVSGSALRLFGDSIFVSATADENKPKMKIIDRKMFLIIVFNSLEIL